METLSTAGMTIYFETENRSAADLVGSSCEKTTHLLAERWGLKIPPDCRVYVMTSWSWFLWHSSPPLYKVLLAITLPLTYWRIRKMWPIAGGWEQQYGKRHTLGVKPPELMEMSDRSLGTRIFVEETDVNEKVEYVTCHELTHAFVSHLRLSNWLKEGLSMMAVDYFAGSPTVRHDSLDVLVRYGSKYKSDKSKRVNLRDPDAVIYLYVRGYWITRYLEEKFTGLLPELLKERMSHVDLETMVASEMDMDRETFWNKIDTIVLAYFTD